MNMRESAKKILYTSDRTCRTPASDVNLICGSDAPASIRTSSFGPGTTFADQFAGFDHSKSPPSPVHDVRAIIVRASSGSAAASKRRAVLCGRSLTLLRKPL